MEVIEKGPVRVGIRVRNKFLGEHTTFVREIYVTAGIPWVEFNTHIEWNGENKLVKVAFPVGAMSKKSTWDIPYGTVERKNTGEERPALKWVDISDGERGTALLNSGRYGYDVLGNVLRLSLLRSPTWPAHNDDGGNHTVRYGMYPHLDNWREGEVHMRGFEFNVPLIAVPVRSHAGPLAGQGSFFTVEPVNVMICACKFSEKGDGVTLRLVETEGRHCEAKLSSHWYLRNAYRTNLLEGDRDRISTDGESLKLEFDPYEIKTVLLQDWGFAPLR